MDIDTDEFLKQWHETKSKINDLEKKLDKFKKVAEKIIPERQGTLESKYYTLLKKEQKRKTISKDKVPSNVWETYSTTVTYPVYYIKKTQKTK